MGMDLEDADLEELAVLPALVRFSNVNLVLLFTTIEGSTHKLKCYSIK